jgi:hypothetical protein
LYMVFKMHSSISFVIFFQFKQEKKYLIESYLEFGNK